MDAGRAGMTVSITHHRGVLLRADERALERRSLEDEAVEVDAVGELDIVRMEIDGIFARIGLTIDQTCDRASARIDELEKGVSGTRQREADRRDVTEGIRRVLPKRECV